MPVVQSRTMIGPDEGLLFLFLQAYLLENKGFVFFCRFESFSFPQPSVFSSVLVFCRSTDLCSSSCLFPILIQGYYSVGYGVKIYSFVGACGLMTYVACQVCTCSMIRGILVLRSNKIETIKTPFMV